MQKTIQKKSSLWIRGLVLATVVAISAVAANADIITYQYGVSPSGYTGSQDTSLWLGPEGQTATWWSTYDLLCSGGDKLRGLIRYDIDPLPEGQMLVSATLKLYLVYTDNGTAMDVSAYQVLKDSVAAEADWNNAKTGLAWETPGASGVTDRKQTAEDTVAVSTTGAWYEWDLTDLVGLWLAGTEDNYGVLLVNAQESVLASKNFASNEHGTASQHPILELEYIPIPEPVTAITLLLGGFAALLARRKRG